MGSWRQVAVIVLACAVIVILVSPAVDLPRTALRSVRQAHAIFQSMADAALVRVPTLDVADNAFPRSVASLAGTVELSNTPPTLDMPLLC